MNLQERFRFLMKRYEASRNAQAEALRQAQEFGSECANLQNQIISLAKSKEPLPKIIALEVIAFSRKHGV